MDIRAVMIPQAFQIALQRHHAGRLAEAEAIYRQILAVEPKHPDALHLLGVIAHQVGRDDLAVEWIGQAIAINPGNPDAHFNLGETLRAIGRMDEAIASFRRAIELRPGYTVAHNNLGVALAAQTRLDEAVDAFQHALQIKPDYLDAQNNLGNALKDLGRLDEAIAAYLRALELKPDFLEVHHNLGIALRERGQLDEAIASFRRALQIQPQHAQAHSNLIYALLFHPGHDRLTIAGERGRWNRQFGDPLKRIMMPIAGNPGAERRLRIGYVSPDFRDHVVGRNVLPLFEHHDRREFEILCYEGVARPDRLTEEFRRRADLWRSTLGVADDALAEMIRRDRVDVLVDLTQHMAGNRLLVFARQPAPIQVSFAGYPESAGLEAIEYRISDRYLEASLSDEKTETKEHVRLIDSFWCYDPRGDDVEVNGLPARDNGRLTFGCLNNFCKVNEWMLGLWARVLGKVKDSHLILLVGAGSRRPRTLATLEKEGVEADRVEFVEYRPRREYLELYHRLDIVLDTAPYNGHTTSLDALWMGVPVVSLAGDPPVSRAGLSQLTNLGLPELVAHSEEDYVRIAVELAEDLPRLSQLRSTLRDRMKMSVLMNAPHFTQQVEQAYREMRQAWLTRQAPIRE